MVFVRKVPTVSGVTAVQIARRENGRDVVDEHGGSAHTDVELSASMLTARSMNEEGQGVLDLGLESEQELATAVVQAQASRLLVDVVGAAWRRLGFDVIEDEAFFHFVLARLVEPTSMSDAVRVLTGLGVTPAHRKTLSASLLRCGLCEPPRQDRNRLLQPRCRHGRLVVVSPRGDHALLRGREARRPPQDRLFQGTPCPRPWRFWEDLMIGMIVAAPGPWTRHR